MNIMKELFEKQLSRHNPLTEEVLGNLKDKTYFNGEEKKVGEIVLLAFLVGDIIESNDKYPELTLKLITLNERHLDLFEYNDRHTGTDIPAIKLKK